MGLPRIRGTATSRRLQRIPGFRPLAIRALTTWERMRTGVSFCPFGASYLKDPGRHYLPLVTKDPVHWSSLFNRWVISGHAEATAALRDPALSVSLDPMGNRHRPYNAFEQFLSETMLQSDPPAHTRLRTAVNRAFTPASVGAVSPFAEAEAARLIEGLSGRATFDLLTEFALPLAASVVAEIVGVPVADHRRFRSWILAMTAFLDPAPEPAVVASGIQATAEAMAYCDELLSRTSAADGSMAGALLADAGGEGGLSHDETRSMLLFLLVAGQETTTNLICNSVALLLSGGRSFASLAGDGEHIDDIIEEVLRLSGPVQMLLRTASRDCVVGRVAIRRGQGVLIAVGAANVDPRIYPEPLNFIPGRPRNHLSFGHGAHYCLGAPLARMEGRLALTALARAFPNLRLVASEPEFRPTIILRGLQRLMVSPGPAAPSPVPTPAATAEAGGPPAAGAPPR